MATRSMDSQAEYLRKIANLIAEAKFAQDADLSFWIGLETEVLQKAHEGTKASPAAAQLGGAAVDMGAQDIDQGAMLMGAGAGMGAGGGMLPMGGGGPPAGLPGPGGPMPAMPGVKFTPDMMRNALRGGGIQGG